MGEAFDLQTKLNAARLLIEFEISDEMAHTIVSYQDDLEKLRNHQTTTLDEARIHSITPYLSVVVDQTVIISVKGESIEMIAQLDPYGYFKNKEVEDYLRTLDLS